MSFLSFDPKVTNDTQLESFIQEAKESNSLDGQG
jgi:hypothetical protein